MQPQEPHKATNRKDVAGQPYGKHSADSFNLLQYFPTRTSIRKKIGFGYALAIGIAVAGTLTGQLVGEYYVQQAVYQQELAHTEEHLLSEVRISLLEARSHQQQLISLIENSAQFQQEYAHFLENIEDIQEHLAEIKSYIAEHATEDTDIATLEKWLQTYEGTAEAYSQQVEAMLKGVKPDQLSPAVVATVQRSLSKFTVSEVATKFDRFSDELAELIEDAHEEELAAETAARQALTLRLFLINSSLLLAIVMAVLLAHRTSRAISHPLEAVTQVAQQVTQESNFTLQAPVTTNDEVGQLAIAFNSLIQQVLKYTQDLELARQTLEKRVEERTEELWQKNEQLEKAHDHLQQLNVELVSQSQELNQAMQNLRQTQTQLIQTEKMSSLGQMVAGIAHEINNPINFIQGNLSHANNYVQDLLSLVQLYQQHYPEPTVVIKEQIEAIDLEFLSDDLTKLLASMQLGTERIRQIVVSLRNFSRLDEAEMKPVDIHEGIDSTLLILGNRIKQNVDVLKQYGDLPLVECYPAQLNQVFMNIISNAIDALMAQEKQAHKQIVIQTAAIASDQVEIRIQDNGPGIPAEAKRKLFDPFFTTKPVGQGTGLGLSISYQIVEKHHGKIEVISEPEQGAVFVIVLPVQAIHSD